MVTTLVDLLLPGSCVGCAAPGASLCRRCAPAVARPRRHAPRPPPPDLPPVWAAGDYAGGLRAAVLAYKERGRRDLVRPLGIGLGRAARRAAGGSNAVWLVPVPARRPVARARGGDHVRRLARVAAGHLGQLGVAARVCAPLRVVGRPRDSAGLGAAERVANLSGAFTVHGRWPPPGRAAVLLLDDVVTTGATLAEAARTLDRAGLPVTGAAVVAATARLHPYPSGPCPRSRVL